MPDATGLSRGGFWIGVLERILVVVFVCLGEYSAIGFLIAAKSILRFPDVKPGGPGHKMSEYVIIGTMLSLIIAIAIGQAILLLTRWY